MLPILAWRNIWRNPTRSLVVILAISMGIWAALFMSGFATGMIRDYIDSNISNVVGHIQIHHPDYGREKDVRLKVDPLPGLEAFLASQTQVRAYSARTLATGMVSTANGSRGILIQGVRPDQEAAVSNLRQNIREGTYFEEGRKNQILLGKSLAEKLHVKLRSKVVLTFQDLEGNITNGAFRIVGLFHSGNTPFDESRVLVQANDLGHLLHPANQTGVPVPVHEIILLCRDPDSLVTVQKTLQAAFPRLLSENYREIAPELELYESQMKSVSLIYLTVIMLALIFGIINTMMMAVLERFRELGMLMAIGMNKVRIFSMIVMETVLLSLAGAPLGLLLGGLTIHYFKVKGLDLSAFAKSLNQYGMGTDIRFDADPGVYWQTAIMLVVTAFLASLYPAWKAIRLKPVEAIRKL